MDRVLTGRASRARRSCALLVAAVLFAGASSAFASKSSEGLDKARLLKAARLGGDYLVRVQKRDGSFHYWYDPVKNRFSSGHYNILRHAGAAISLFELYAATGDSKYLIAARRAVAYLKTRFRRADGSGVYVLDYDQKAKLGASGLALIALAKVLAIEHGSSNADDAVKLARFIVSMQHSDGSFQSYYRVRGDEPEGDVSLYYPGEALLGLVSLYNITHDASLLEAARRGADYLIRSQQALSELPPDAWLMQALEALHKIGDDSRYAGHAIALAQAMIGQQYTNGEPQYEGGFGPGEPRSTPAASRAEGLLAAYRLGRSVGDPGRSRIARALQASARFQLSQQYTAETVTRLANPATALGGFRESFSSPRIRIDFVQHNISSLLGIAETLY